MLMKAVFSGLVFSLAMGWECRERELKVLVDFMQDVRTCDELLDKYFQWSDEGKHLPLCDYGVSWINDNGSCDDDHIVKAGRILLEKYEAYEAARFLDSAKKECYIGCFKAPKYVLADAGKSCVEACAAQDGTCDLPAIKALAKDRSWTGDKIDALGIRGLARGYCGDTTMWNTGNRNSVPDIIPGNANPCRLYNDQPNRENEITCEASSQAPRQRICACSYGDNHHRDFDKMLSGNFDVKTCRANCAKLGYKYFSMQKGHQCFCDHDYATPKDTYVKVDDMECVRDGFQLGLGGAWRNSVYKTVCDYREPTPAPTAPLKHECKDWCDPECRDNECCGGSAECMACPIPGCGPSASACEDWCDPECRDNECCGGHESCMGCPIPGCAASRTPEPTPAPTPHQEPGCEDWCYEELDCLDPDEKWGYGEWFMEECGECDIPLCQDDAQGCEDWCDPECRENECCGGHESCMGCPIPGCAA